MLLSANFFLLAFVHFVAIATPVTWYQQQDLGEFHLNWVISRDCYRGTYGSLSLFTCPLQHVHLEPFTEVSSGTQLCVIQTRSHKEATRIVAESADVQLLFDDLEKYLVIGSIKNRHTAYPELCSRSAFGGAALNVMTVAEHSFRPSTTNVLSGKENITSDAITDFIAQVSAADLQTLVTQLAFGPGTGPAPNTWVTRNSLGSDAVIAVNWIDTQLRSAGGATQQIPFLAAMCNNVVAEFPGLGALAKEVIFLGAHADSRNEQPLNGTTPAPGADDNGSGTAIAINFARIIQKQRAAGALPAFQRTLRIGTFCGEEQGLLGSRNLANSYANDGTQIVGMYNVDMVGYRPSTNGTLDPIVIAFMTGSASPDFTASCKQIIQNYLPNQAIGDTTACCSDQQSFYSAGFTALGVFETPTADAIYPDYHQRTDTPDKVNYEQLQAFAQGIYSCALTSVLYP